MSHSSPSIHYDPTSRALILTMSLDTNGPELWIIQATKDDTSSRANIIGQVCRSGNLQTDRVPGTSQSATGLWIQRSIHTVHVGGPPTHDVSIRPLRTGATLHEPLYMNIARGRSTCWRQSRVSHPQRAFVTYSSAKVTA